MASIAVIGICLHFPSFSAMIDMTALSNASSGNILIQPSVAAQGSNLIPIVFFSFITFMIAALAILPKIAPPVIPMAVISMLGWIWLLVSGTIPIR